MPIKMTHILVLAALATPAVAQKEILRGPGGSDIYQDGDHVIEVVSNMGDDPRGYWCGAVKYGREAKMDWDSKIYVVSGPAPTSFKESGDGVKFTMDPAAAGVSAGANGDSFAPGTWMTMSEANRGCDDIDNPHDGN
ncbi:hypothetical protein LA6_003756 [Marinibacterium anthonyi]|nr:hypothetical protein LA6_003756 [Marinibacterium anthonyi]